jgi:hypothetical protein
MTVRLGVTLKSLKGDGLDKNLGSMTLKLPVIGSARTSFQNTWKMPVADQIDHQLERGPNKSVINMRRVVMNVKAQNPRREEKKNQKCPSEGQAGVGQQSVRIATLSLGERRDPSALTIVKLTDLIGNRMTGLMIMKIIIPKGPEISTNRTVHAVVEQVEIRSQKAIAMNPVKTGLAADQLQKMLTSRTRVRVIMMILMMIIAGLVGPGGARLPVVRGALKAIETGSNKETPSHLMAAKLSGQIT